MTVDAALQSFAWDNPESLSVVDSLETSELILDGLMERGMDVRGLIMRACQSHYETQLFVFLVQRFRDGPRWLEFIEVILRTPAPHWSKNNGYLAEQMVIEELIPHIDPVVLFDGFGHLLCLTSHPLFELISADAYWREKACLAFLVGKPQAAWEVVRKARLGFTIRDPLPKGERKTVHYNLDPRHRCFRASPECLRDLFDRFVHILKEKKILSANEAAAFVERLFSSPKLFFRTKLPIE